MASSTGQQERRQAFRCPVVGPRWSAELRIDHQRIPVRLLDQSTGGFAVLSPVEPPGDGRPVELHCESGRFVVEIRSVFETHLPEDKSREPSSEPDTDGAATDESSTSGESSTVTNDQAETATDAWYRVGLRRVSELDPFESSGEKPPAIALLRPLAALFPTRAPVPIVGIMLAMLFVVGAVTLLLAIGHGLPALVTGAAGPDSVEHRSAGQRSSVDRRRGDQARTTSPNRSTGNRRAPRSQTDSMVDRAADGLGRWLQNAFEPANQVAERAVEGARDGIRAADAHAREQLESLRRLVAASPGVLPFTWPEIADRLGLTSQQLDEVDRLERMTRESLKTLDRRVDMTRAERSEARAAVHQTARREAVEGLTPEQRDRWNELQP